ncbi:MAG: 2-hydroxyacyl-CoA dehydratase [Candidatus Margulisbacteria bacterium]|nr:2-hydroxyacyl-CoA dehydratase [Candidatus Margulisiibacteriota bacterium]
MTSIAFTTTIPQEYIWPTSHVPLDLNNYFITNPDPMKFIDSGERKGMPRNTCSWIKGLLGVLDDLAERISVIIAVTEGDCSNNHALINMYQYYYPHIDIIRFSYPSDKNPEKLKMELDKLGSYFGVSYDKAMHTKKILDQLRSKINKFDLLQNEKNTLSAKTVQQLLVSTTDFNGDYNLFNSQVDAHIQKLQGQQAITDKIKIGYTGVPTIYNDLFDYVENTFPIKVAYFEVEQDFSMHWLKHDLIQQYLAFQYPYDLFNRIQTINMEIERRSLKAIIHYVQSFCHRQIDAALIQKLIKVPVLLLEGDTPGPLDMRTKIRIESFMERLQDENR